MHLPVIDLNLSIHTIKKKHYQFSIYGRDLQVILTLKYVPCTFHLICPCYQRSKQTVPVSFQSITTDHQCDPAHHPRLLLQVSSRTKHVLIFNVMLFIVPVCTYANK